MVTRMQCDFCKKFLIDCLKELEKEDEPRCPYCLTPLNPFEVWWAVVEGHTGCGVGFGIAFFGCAGLAWLVGKVPALDLGWPIYLTPVIAGIGFTCVYFYIVLTRKRGRHG